MTIKTLDMSDVDSQEEDSPAFVAPHVVDIQIAGLSAKKLLSRHDGIESQSMIMRHFKESSERYEQRKKRMHLDNMYKEVVSRLSSRTLSEDIKVNNAPPSVDNAIQSGNVNLSGMSMTTFAKEVLSSGLAYGLTFIMADNNKSDDSYSSLGDINSGELRPYFRHINIFDALDYRVEFGKVSYFRFMTSAIISTGDFSKEAKKVIVEIDKDNYTTYQQQKDKKWVVADSFKNQLGKVPVVIFSPDDSNISPISNAVKLQKAHINNYSELNTCLEYAGHVIMNRYGVVDSDKLPKVVGHGAVQDFQNDKARVEYLESNGTAAGSYITELSRIEERLRSFAMHYTTSNSAAETATGRGIDNANAMAPIEGWAKALEDCIKMAINLLADMMGEEVSNDLEVVVKPKTTRIYDVSMLNSLLGFYNAGVLGREDVINVLQDAFPVLSDRTAEEIAQSADEVV